MLVFTIFVLQPIYGWYDICSGSSTSTASQSGSSSGTVSSFRQRMQNLVHRSSTQSTTAGVPISRGPSDLSSPSAAQYLAALMPSDRDTTATTLTTMLYDDDGNALRQVSSLKAAITYLELNQRMGQTGSSHICEVFDLSAAFDNTVTNR